jgi:hypothetical protein
VHANAPDISRGSVRLSAWSESSRRLGLSSRSALAELSGSAAEEGSHASTFARRPSVAVLRERSRWRNPFPAAVSAAMLVCGGCGDSGRSGPDVGCGQGVPCLEKMGEIALGFDVNHCPSLDFLYLAPSRLSLGRSANFAASATDPDGDWVDHFWSTTGGELAASAASVDLDTFTCLESGTETLTFWYFDTRGCARSEAADIDCVSRSDDTGG